MTKIIELKILILIITISISSVKAQRIKDYPFSPVPFTSVSINDEFWAPRINTNREVTIPDTFKKAKRQGELEILQLQAD